MRNRILGTEPLTRSRAAAQVNADLERQLRVLLQVGAGFGSSPSYLDMQL